MEQKNTEQRFALCIENSDCDDLEKQKICQVLHVDEAEKKGYLRSSMNRVRIIFIPNPISFSSNYPAKHKRHFK